jgi:hypothetical protein
VQVAAADADVGDFEQDVFFTDDGSGDLADLDGALFGGEINDGCVLHGGIVDKLDGWIEECERA